MPPTQFYRLGDPFGEMVQRDQDRMVQMASILSQAATARRGQDLMAQRDAAAAKRDEALAERTMQETNRKLYEEAASKVPSRIADQMQRLNASEISTREAFSNIDQMTRDIPQDILSRYVNTEHIDAIRSAVRGFSQAGAAQPPLDPARLLSGSLPLNAGPLQEQVEVERARQQLTGPGGPSVQIGGYTIPTDLAGRLQPGGAQPLPQRSLSSIMDDLGRVHPQVTESIPGREPTVSTPHISKQVGGPSSSIFTTPRSTPGGTALEMMEQEDARRRQALADAQEREASTRVSDELHDIEMQNIRDQATRERDERTRKYERRQGDFERRQKLGDAEAQAEDKWSQGSTERILGALEKMQGLSETAKESVIQVFLRGDLESATPEEKKSFDSAWDQVKAAVESRKLAPDAFLSWEGLKVKEMLAKGQNVVKANYILSPAEWELIYAYVGKKEPK